MEEMQSMMAALQGVGGLSTNESPKVKMFYKQKRDITVTKTALPCAAA
jgi:hypothetical protein